MLYRLKKAIMCRMLDKRNGQNPFDFQTAENYSLAGEKDPLLNNSYYFSAHTADMSVFARLGKRVHVDETWFAVFREGRMYSLKQESFPSGQSPLLVRKDGERWSVAFRGILNESDEIDFEAVFEPGQAPVDFTSNMPAERMATGIANEKWSRKLFGELQTISGQCHYEQEGTLEGQFTLNGERVSFSLPCVRDHSFGKRDWDYMNNHLWLMAVSPELQFNYSLVSYPVISALEVGNYRDGSGMHYMLEADLDFRQVSRGTIPQELSFRMRLDHGRSIPVTARVIAGVSYHFQDDKYILHENIAAFEIDGKVCRGILEIGFNADGNRHFNQRDLSTIKR